jgi:HK97 family phage prohead protease
MAKIETRNYEIRAAADFTLEGYACTFNSLSKPLPTVLSNGTFVEKILPGSFTGVLSRPYDVRCLFNHDANRVLGRTPKTLELTQDDKGLRFRCQLDPNNSDHTNIYSSVKRGDLSECSFAFQLDDRDDDSWTTDGKGRNLRTIKKFAALYDVSIVASPAYEGTSVAARNTAHGAIYLNEDAVLRAQLSRLKVDIDRDVRMNPIIALALRNKTSVARLEDAELRLKWRKQAAELMTDEDN